MDFAPHVFLTRGSKSFSSLQCDRSLARSFPHLTVGLFGRMALDGIRMPDGCYADGTWELKMHVTDLHRDVSLRVTGEIHIGGVMLKLVEKLGMHSRTLLSWRGQSSLLRFSNNVRK